MNATELKRHLEANPERAAALILAGDQARFQQIQEHLAAAQATLRDPDAYNLIRGGASIYAEDVAWLVQKLKQRAPELVQDEAAAMPPPLTPSRRTGERS